MNAIIEEYSKFTQYQHLWCKSQHAKSQQHLPLRTSTSDADGTLSVIGSSSVCNESSKSRASSSFSIFASIDDHFQLRGHYDNIPTDCHNIFDHIDEELFKCIGHISTYNVTAKTLKYTKIETTNRNSNAKIQTNSQHRLNPPPLQTPIKYWAKQKHGGNEKDNCPRRVGSRIPEIQCRIRQLQC